jgi:hypothetical protein
MSPTMGLILVHNVLDFLDDSGHDCGCVLLGNWKG